MKSRYLIYVLAVVFQILLNSYAVPQENYAKRLQISLNANYTTSSKLYPYPAARDIIVRSTFIALDKIVSPSVDIRYRISEAIFIGLSTELMEETRQGRNLTVSAHGGTRSVLVDDGFRFIPVELFIHYLLPFSTESLKFYMGGGAAYYYGERIRRFGNASISTADRKFSYGIQVNVSSEYMITDYLSIRSEMKFRDPEFEIKSRYDSRTVKYEGETVFLQQDSFDSKVNIDGVTFTLGLALHL